jgi:hypothetical protein
MDEQHDTGRMEMTALEKNTRSLDKEIKWFETLVDKRIHNYFSGQEKNNSEPVFTDPPDLSHDNSNYAELVNYYQMGIFERILLMLAFIPHIKPQMLDVFFSRNANYNKEFTEFGGFRGSIHQGFLPTAETASFILAGNNLNIRFSLQSLLDENHYLRKHQIIALESESGRDPFFSRPLKISKEILTYLTTGTQYKPDFSPSFPAALLSTRLEWNDLVLDHDVWEDIEEINNWIKYGEALLSTGDLGKKLKKGYRALFYGPPGTGKTLTATLLGKSNNLDVYRIDLSMVVSKYIGETEKNLAGVFDMAENKNWILFFDEADALFGKRTATKDSKDRYANQEISYLLQRIEDFPGIVILATNLKSNIDEAFARRFQSMIYFPIPSTELRTELWNKAFGQDFELAPSVDIHSIAKNYEMSGGAITNVLRYCGLKALSRQEKTIMQEDILAGIRKELIKEGKTS